VAGVDHVPIAVRDLEAARERYRALGFAFKPGRPHDDGIRNLNLKFPDGTQLELITVVGTPGSSLAERYARHLATGGDGPKFAGLWAPDLERLDGPLEALEEVTGQELVAASGLRTFTAGGPLEHLFFGRRNRAPNDRPEHFAHPNGAESLVGIWLASEPEDGAPSPERRVLEALGVAVRQAALPGPLAAREGALLGRVDEGFVALLPVSLRLRPDRPIVGVTVRVRDLDTARSALEAGGIDPPPVVEHEAGRSLFVPPETALGVWLELREPPGGTRKGPGAVAPRGRMSRPTGLSDRS
jgi:catechol 2,3-dioxygenase-like lactoylglutathione lyase family enzyme